MIRGDANWDSSWFHELKVSIVTGFDVPGGDTSVVSSVKGEFPQLNASNFHVKGIRDSPEVSFVSVIRSAGVFKGFGNVVGHHGITFPYNLCLATFLKEVVRARTKFGSVQY